jgi:dTDP-4-dehydrorhamnose 3,5-epimerase
MQFTDTKLDANTLSGVEFKELITFNDDRGFFREVIRCNDPFFGNGFGQWSHSKMAKNTVKAWHYHHLQIDWWYVPIGVIHVVLYDDREESSTFKKKIEFKLGEDDSSCLNAVVKIPQGVVHGCRVLTDFAHLFYVTSKTYNPKDEGRHPFDSDHVPHSWGSNDDLIVSANDKVGFIPESAREKLNNS